MLSGCLYFTQIGLMVNAGENSMGYMMLIHRNMFTTLASHSGIRGRAWIHHG